MNTGRAFSKRPFPALLASVATVALFVVRPATAQEAAPAPPGVAEPPAEAGFFSRPAPQADRARLGIFLQLECEATAESDGECSSSPVVSSVIENAPAAAAGIQPGDTLIALNGISLKSERGRRALGELQAGVAVRLEVGRSGERRQFQVTPAPRPMAGQFDVNVRRGTWWPRETAEVRVFRFRNDDGGMAEFYFSPTPQAPPAPEGFVVFGQDEAGDLRLETGRPGVVLRTHDGRRIELAELARHAHDDTRLKVEVESVEGNGSQVRHRIVLENAQLAERLESVRAKALEQARVRFDSLRLRRAEPDHPGFRFSAVAPEHRLAGAEFRPLTPELAEYFPVDAGLLVLRVIPATPAHEIGLRGGDVVVEVGGRKMPDVNLFRRLVSESLAAGEGLDVKWNRKGKEMAGRLLDD